MPVSTITLESTNGDTVVVSAPHEKWTADYLGDSDIILDVDPQGMYDTAFTVRTMSGAFETGDRIVGESVPIREPVLPFWLSKASRARFQKLWGSPGNFQKVKCTWDGPSGPRSLTLKLAKEIAYATEDGFDADIDGIYHAVVSALAVNPMYEGVENISQFTNPGGRYTLKVEAIGGNFPLTYAGSTASGIAWNVSPATLQSSLEALPSVGAGHVTVTGIAATSISAGQYTIQFTGVTGTLTGSGEISTLTVGGIWGALGWAHGHVTVSGANVGWFEVWNPTDQPLWLEWIFDPATSWQFPDFGFGQERKWGRPVGSDDNRMIVTVAVTSLLSVNSDPFMDTYVTADLSNFAGLMNGVEPLYMVPPYTGTEDEPVLMPVICNGPVGARAILRQRRFWSAESGLEA